MIQPAPKLFYDDVINSASKLANLQSAIMRSNAYRNNVTLYVPQIADTSNNEIAILMCIDVVRCAQMMGIDFMKDTKESFGVQMLCYQILTYNSWLTNRSWNEWEKVSANIKYVINNILKHVPAIKIQYPNLIIPTILGTADNDNKNQYLVLLYRWASIVAKADGTITIQEQDCLSRLLQTPLPQTNNPSDQSVKQKNDPVEIEQTKQEHYTDPFTELESLIGLDSVKQEVMTFANFVRVQQARKANGMKTTPVSYHCIFTGNPGTGKTTIARIIAAIYKELGIIKGGQLIETDRSGLVGEFIGSTALKTNKVIDSALDGVLFIDEAYSLAEGGANDFGKEAIATLIKRMEDERDRLIVILAGYTQNMNSFLNANPGIQSRISRIINFPDYSVTELVDIFIKCVEKYEYTLTPGGLFKVNDVIQKEYDKKSRYFGNARFVRNLFERTIEHQANRLAKQPKITQESLAEITGEDIY